MADVDGDSVHPEDLADFVHNGRPGCLHTVDIQDGPHVVAADVVDIDDVIVLPETLDVHSVSRHLYRLVILLLVLLHEAPVDALHLPQHRGTGCLFDLAHHQHLGQVHRVLKGRRNRVEEKAENKKY